MSSSATSEYSWAKACGDVWPAVSVGLRRNRVGNFGESKRTNRIPVCELGAEVNFDA